MSVNRVNPSPDGSVEVHHLQRLGDGETNHVNVDNHEDGVNFGGKPDEVITAETRVDDQLADHPAKTGSIPDINPAQTGNKLDNPAKTGNYVDDWEEVSNMDETALPGSPDYRGRSPDKGDKPLSPDKGDKSRSPDKGFYSGSQERGYDSVSPINPWSSVASASPDRKLPITPDIEIDPTEGQRMDVYTPAAPRLDPDQEPEQAKYDSPTASVRSSRSGSLAELLPSQKMVPLAPIGSNRITPIDKPVPGPQHKTAIPYKAPLPAINQGGAGNQPVTEQATPAYQGGSAVNTHSDLRRRYSSRELLHENIRPSDGNTDGAGCCSWVLYMFSILLIVFTLPFSLMFTIKVVQEYERAVIFRLGRLPSGGAKGPGIFFIIPCIESYSKVDLRTVSFDVPPQEVLTKDSVTVSVDAVVYYRVSNPTVSVANVENAHHSTRLLAQTTLRNILGTKNMSEILSDRETISHGMQSTLDVATDRWGIKVERVEIKDVRLPVQLQRAMAAEAEAAREACAKVIAAEGEQRASKALKEAADVMCQSSTALQLRYLQTLNSISAEKNSTIIFPLPVDILSNFLKAK